MINIATNLLGERIEVKKSYTESSSSSRYWLPVAEGVCRAVHLSSSGYLVLTIEQDAGGPQGLRSESAEDGELVSVLWEHDVSVKVLPKAAPPPLKEDAFDRSPRGRGRVLLEGLLSLPSPFPSNPDDDLRREIDQLRENILAFLLGA